MPAEWEPHEATWLAWPHEKSDWPGKFAPIPWIYGEIVRHLARVERVRILVQDAAEQRAALRVLKKCHADVSAVEFHLHSTDRSWIRDYGPIFVKSALKKSAGEIAITHWRFNGWAKYDNWRNDARVPATIARKLEIPSRKTSLVLEGGSIDVNGAGQAADHGGMPALRGPGAQSRTHTRRSGAGVRNLSGDPRGRLAGPRHRGRRHSRTH